MDDDPGLGGGGSNMKTQKRDRAYTDNQTACDLCCLAAELKK